MSIFIQYRGYFRGPRDTGGTTSLYASAEEALKQAKACSFKDDTAWVNPEFVGTLDTVLMATAPIEYIDWKPTPQKKVIPAGESFVVGDIMVADHQVTRAMVGLWLTDGRAEVV